MRFLFISVLVSLFVSKAEASRKFLGTAGDISHFIEDVQVTDEMRLRIQNVIYPPAILPDETLPVDIGTILNAAKEIWKIIEANRPVVNVTFDYANALPKGVKTSEDLEGFSDLQMKAFRVYGTNLYGMTVYDVTYTSIHRFGGSYSGKGKYLENVTILPQNVEVLWGYTLNMNIGKVSVVNAGTKEDPIASLLMQMDLSVSTVIKESRMKHVFQFRGDSKNCLTTSESH